MSLMHCLETIRWNQKHANGTGTARLVPFRETKLTRLFQVGAESVHINVVYHIYVFLIELKRWGVRCGVGSLRSAEC